MSVNSEHILLTYLRKSRGNKVKGVDPKLILNKWQKRASAKLKRLNQKQRNHTGAEIHFSLSIYFIP